MINQKLFLPSVSVLVTGSVFFSAQVLATQSLTVPMPYDYSWDMDASSSTCTNTSSEVVISGPLTIKYGSPYVTIHMRQNSQKHSDPDTPFTVSVAPQGGTINASKKGKGLGNPYISFKDDQTNAYGQLGRCVAQSNQSVYNRLKNDGNAIALFSSALTAMSCSNKGSSLNFSMNHNATEAYGKVYLSNQLLLDPPTSGGYGANLSVQIVPPNNLTKGGKINGQGGNPFVSQQVSNCALRNYTSQNDFKNCETDINYQNNLAVTKGNTIFPYLSDGSQNPDFEDVLQNKWNTGMTIKKFKLWGPVLTDETTPTRCNQM